MKYYKGIDENGKATFYGCLEDGGEACTSFLYTIKGTTISVLLDERLCNFVREREEEESKDIIPTTKEEFLSHLLPLMSLIKLFAAVSGLM